MPDFLSNSNMHQIQFRLGLRPRPRWGAYSAPQTQTQPIRRFGPRFWPEPYHFWKRSGARDLLTNLFYYSHCIVSLHLTCAVYKCYRKSMTKYLHLDPIQSSNRFLPLLISSASRNRVSRVCAARKQRSNTRRQWQHLHRCVVSRSGS